MATQEGLSILLQGEVNNLVKAIKEAREAITSLGGNISSLSGNFGGLSKSANNAAKDLDADAAAAKRANTQFDSLSKAPKNTAASFTSFERSAKGAGTTLTSFGRIVQDAPYGIIGIGNNITQFAEQFQYLRQNTGSAGSALKAMASSLLGAGGLTFGISILISGVTVLTQKYGSLTNAILALSGGYGKLAQIQDAVNKEISESLGGAQGEIVRAQSLLKIINDESEARKTRLNALKEIQKEYPGYFDNIKLEGNLTIELVSAHDKLILVLKRHAKAKAILGQIEKNYTEILNVQNKNVIASASAWQTFSSLVINGSNAAATASELAAQGAKNQKEQIDQLNKSTESLTKQYDELIKQDAINNTFRDPTKAEKTGKHIRTVADILKVLNASLAATDAQYKLFGGTTDNLAQEKLKALNKAFDDLVKIGLKPTSPELKKVADQINLISASIIGVEPLTTVLAQKLGKQVKITKVKPLTPEQLAELTGIKEESQLFLKPKINIEPIYQTTPALENLDKFSKLFTAKMAKMAKDAKDAFNKNYIVWGNALTSGLTPAIVNLGELMRNGLNNAFSAVGESLGKAITGGGLSDVLSGIISTMSDFIIAFGRQLVEAGTLALIAQRYIIANPALAIAAGVAAIALGSALKNAVPAFATGGTVNGPTLAMVGDNPSGVEHIIPQEVLDRLGGGNDGFIAEARVSGTDLLVLVKQAERNQGR